MLFETIYDILCKSPAQLYAPLIGTVACEMRDKSFDNLVTCGCQLISITYSKHQHWKTHL